MSFQKVPFSKNQIQNFINSMYVTDIGGYRSVPDGPVTLYGTCYALLARYYLGQEIEIDPKTTSFIRNCQIESGEFIGPELEHLDIPSESIHNREHLINHLTCTALPVCLQFDIPIRYPLKFAQWYCDIANLSKWFNERDFKYSWTEGNNIFFIGELLVYLRDIEKFHKAENALEFWYSWLEDHIDPQTSLWGSDGSDLLKHTVYGGYHQLLVYYHENFKIRNPKGLVDTVLSLQHRDGGFNPSGNAGACEDVDSVDILVNMYKRFNYRRGDIRYALRRCLNHINTPQSHMNIPGTQAAANISCMFPTWFRIHTIALISEILQKEKVIKDINFRFSDFFSMGWHKSPAEWEERIRVRDIIDENFTLIRHRYLNRRTIKRILKV
jgi:hypothetical protein